MPTNPVSPNTEAAVDRLTLGIESPRGAEPTGAPGAMCCMGCAACFEAEPSMCTIPGACFEAE